MTPAIVALEREQIQFKVHEFRHNPRVGSYGQEAAEQLGVDPKTVFKTLIVELEPKEFVVALVPVLQQLDLKLIAQAAGVKRGRLAHRSDAERITGYRVGGVSPLGQRKRLRSYVDRSAQDCTTVFVSAGRRGLEVELAPYDLAATIGALFCDLSG